MFWNKKRFAKENIEYINEFETAADNYDLSALRALRWSQGLQNAQVRDKAYRRLSKFTPLITGALIKNSTTDTAVVNAAVLYVAVGCTAVACVAVGCTAVAYAAVPYVAVGYSGSICCGTV